jgi:uncharacterized membrane protein
MMHPSSLNFFPLAAPFVLDSVRLAGLLLALIEVGIFGYAYANIKGHRQFIFIVLLLSFLGGSVNIPVAQLPEEQVLSGQEIPFFGMQYVIPVVEEQQGTIVALNVGGAIIPILLSLYPLLRHGIYGRGLPGVAIMTAIVHGLAHPIRGMGIALSFFIPPAAAAITTHALPTSLLVLPREREGILSVRRALSGRLDARGPPANVARGVWTLSPGPFFA